MIIYHQNVCKCFESTHKIAHLSMTLIPTLNNNLSLLLWQNFCTSLPSPRFSPMLLSWMNRKRTSGLFVVVFVCRFCMYTVSVRKCSNSVLNLSSFFHRFNYSPITWRPSFIANDIYSNGFHCHEQQWKREENNWTLDTLYAVYFI